MIRRSLPSRTVLSIALLLSIVLASSTFLSSADAKAAPSTGSGGGGVGSPILMDTSGGLRLKIPTIPTNDGVVAIITSPGSMQSLLTSQQNDDNVLALEDNMLICRGATLQSMTAASKSALALTSLVANAIVVDGITVGDVMAAGWKNTRHARTLTALFRARLALDTAAAAAAEKKQTLVLCVKTAAEKLGDVEKTLMNEVKALFEATAVEAKATSASFGELYSVVVKSVTSEEEAAEVSVACCKYAF